MSYSTFCQLLSQLQDLIMQEKKTWTQPGNRYVPNGPITPGIRLAAALRYFAGGSPLDIMTSLAISHTEVLDSVQMVIDAVNQCFPLEYPASWDAQRSIAAEFMCKSGAGFNNCAGAIDGILIWIQKPNKNDCKEFKCDSGKFYCGRKHKFGLNCQAVADSRGKILDLSIVYPGSTSDCLAFEGSTLFTKLNTTGFLAPGLCLYGDNAYINSAYMAVPFHGQVSGDKDSYNFYHSQLRIRVECAFGMLTERWAILRSAMPRRLPLRKVIMMVCALARLHNFCIDSVDEETIAERPAGDVFRQETAGAVPLVNDVRMRRAGVADVTPRELIGGGHHYLDYDRSLRRRRQDCSPQSMMVRQVAELGVVRPSTS